MSSRTFSFVESTYDVIVIGGGHAGIEAAMATAKLGCKTMLMSMNLDTIGQMSCNPAIGGPAKSQLVKEIDALGGVMGICADATYIQLKTLNASKGPAVQALRAQSDKTEYRNFARTLVESQENLSLRQSSAMKIIIETRNGQRILSGVEDNLGILYPCKALVLANGTFLNGKLFIGEKVIAGGRSGEAAATGITADLLNLGIQTGRLKTGTPPRLDGRTIDFSILEEHWGDNTSADEQSYFSFLPNRPLRKQIPCHMTYTNEKTHAIIQANKHRSPMFSGLIEGTGPRYCPSIEDKVFRFEDKDRHHLFVEPEGLNTYEIYLQGFSSSMPIDVQMDMLKTLPGLGSVSMIRPACAVEYDYFPAYQCEASLMSKHLKGLFLAGQINGTSGYEEAAAQGLIAGINAARYVDNQEPIILPRESSYIGTLIDDLVTKEIREPYRMLTSRSEYRLLLRQDNADSRLTPLAIQLGLACSTRQQAFESRQQKITNLQKVLKQSKVKPDEMNTVLESLDTPDIVEKTSLAELLRRPEVTLNTLAPFIPNLHQDYEYSVRFTVECELKYAGYIQKQQDAIVRLQSMAQSKIPDDINYLTIKQLSNEGREKLDKIKPGTLSQASRIPGLSAADLSIIQVILSQRKKANNQKNNTLHKQNVSSGLI